MDKTDEVKDFVPPDFRPPLVCAGDGFVLEPLGPQHNERDYAAWTSSIDHIRRTPGFPDGRWPRQMTLEENLHDLERHAADFHARSGFTFTVHADDDTGDVIGCVYIYPGPTPRTAAVQSWVRASHAELDRPLYQRVTQWLREAWPFQRVEYAQRPPT